MTWYRLARELLVAATTAVLRFRQTRCASAFIRGFDQVLQSTRFGPV